MVNDSRKSHGFARISALKSIPLDSIEELLGRFDRFSELMGAEESAFAFKEGSVLTVCNEIFISPDEISVTPRMSEADIAFIWGVMASRANDTMADNILYTRIQPDAAGPVLNRRWSMIEKSIETMVEGILASAEASNPGSQHMQHLKDVISEIAWSKKHGEAMLMSQSADRVIPVLLDAYQQVALDRLSEDSVMAISALLSMRGECLSWMYSTHAHQKPLKAPSDFLFRIAECERMSGKDVQHVHDFAIGGLLSHRIFLKTGVETTVGRRFVPTEGEYQVLSPSLEDAIQTVLHKERHEKIARRVL